MAPSGDKRSFEERKAALLSGEKRAKIERDLQARGFRGVSSSIEHITDLRNSLLNTQSTPARDGYPYTNMQKLPATMGSQFNAYVELCGSLQGFGFLKSANENTFNCGVSVTVDYGKKTFDPKLVLRFTYSHDYCEPLAKTRKDGSSTNDMFWLARVGQQADNDAYQLKSVEPSVMTAEKRRYLGVSTDGDGEYVRFRVTCSGWFHKTSDSNFMDYNKAHDHFGKVHPKNADAERSFFKALYDGREVVLDLYVHVNTNAKNYIDEQFPYFQAAIAARVTRLWPYLKATNEDPPQYVCKVNLDLDDVRSICGGILCTYDSNTIAHAERLKTSGERPDKCADWPTPKSVTQITNGEADMVGMGSIQAMQVMMQGAVVREYQATRRPFAVFSTDRVSLTVVKFDRPSTSSTNTNIGERVLT